VPHRLSQQLASMMVLLGAKDSTLETHTSTVPWL